MTIDPGIDPRLAEFAALFDGGMDLSDAGIAAANELVDALVAHAVPQDDDVWTVDDAVTTTPDGQEVRLVVARPRGETADVAVLWFHGGGFVTGRAAQDLDLLKLLVARTGATVVAVDYRLAPGADLDAMVVEGRAAWEWMRSALPAPAQPRRLFLGGESAGGGLATLVALTLSPGEADGLLLLSPMLDDDTQETPGPAPLVWTAENSRVAWHLAGAQRTVALSPARAANLGGLPRTYLEVGTRDVLAREAQEFAVRLGRAGVPVRFHPVEGAIHGYAHAGPVVPVLDLIDRLHSFIDPHGAARSHKEELVS